MSLPCNERNVCLINFLKEKIDLLSYWLGTGHYLSPWGRGGGGGGGQRFLGGSHSFLKNERGDQPLLAGIEGGIRKKYKNFIWR